MNRQLHAGQLRYHDFAALRQATALRRSLHTSIKLHSSIQPFTPSNLLGKQQQRSFLTSIRRQFKLKSLERSANAVPSDQRLQYQFLQELNGPYPEAVVERFENYPEFAVDHRCGLVYLDAIKRCGKEARFDLKGFSKRLEMGGASGDVLQGLQDAIDTGVKKGTAYAAARKVMERGGGAGVQILGGLGGVAGAAVGSGFGSDPKLPIYVQYANKMNLQEQVWKTARLGLGLLLFVSAVGAVLDGRGVSNAIGMGGKHVQEAEGSEVRFCDVCGVEEAKAELEEIVLYLKDPNRFTRLGGKLPKGLLLTGPPGTGKTLLAKAIAGEADVPFFFCSGSQFEEVYVGLGAKRIRELFEAAKKKAPAIIFIDEIDAVGGSRKLKDQSALKMTLNELLVQMDGFEENSGVIVVGATNFAQSLDEALLRPGRFDKRVQVPLPDIGGRKAILDMYAQKTTLAKDVDITLLARGTTGFSGADLFNLMNQAALKASVDGLNAIDMHTLEYAKDKILMGAERKTAIITAKNARNTAFHEAGHALVAVLTDGANQIHKATIMPRGDALGMVTQLPSGDQTSQSCKEMHAYMDICYAGRVAEELVFGKENITSGASSDIMQATRTARAMVTKYGFSDEIGFVYHAGDTGKDSASGHTQSKIDEEVKRLTSQAYQRATNLLKKYAKEHHLLAETLMEYETLTGDEIRDLVKTGRKPRRPIINKTGGARGDQTMFDKEHRGVSGVDGKLGNIR